MIDPNTAITIRVGELPSQPFNLTDNIPHEVGNELKRGTVQQLSDLIASVINVSGGVGFRAVTVVDGQTLPSTTEQEFILVGKGTYYNVSGGETLVLTEELNAIVSNGYFWFIGVEIPVNVELAGITQEIRQGFLNTTPSENTVFNALQGIDLSSKENTANKQNSLTPDGTGNKYPTIDIINSGLSKKIKIVIEGDSRSALPSPTPIFWDTYFKQNSTLGKEAKIINIASGGDTIENMILTFNSQVLPHAPVNGELAYFILYAGANDLGPGLGHTGAVVYEDWKTLVTLAKNAGFIVVAGCDAGAAIGWTTGQRNQCNIFNDLIRSDKSYYSFLLEPDLVLPASDVSNYSDGIHFTNLGSERFAKHVAQKLSEIESSNLPLEISRFNNMLVNNNTTSNNTVSKGGLTSFSSENGGIYNYYSGGGVVASFSDNAGTFSQLNLEALNFVFKANGVSKFFLNQSGNLGLGTSFPVNNTGYAGFSLNGASGSIQSFMQNSVETFRIGNYEGYSFIDTTGNTPLLFGTNSNEAFRISESGNAVFLNAPTAPTAAAGTNTTQIATTAFVQSNINSNAVLLTGTQIITGTKQFTSPAGGNGIFSLNNSTSNGIELSNTSAGVAVKSVSSSSGNNIVSNHTGTGLNYVGQNNGTNTFTVDKTGKVEASKLNLSTTAGAQSVGNANMVAGSVTITTTAATTNSVIMLTRNSVGITGFLTYTTANGSFTINSNVIGDAGVISYVIFN
jgi:lysophospholipase L1-like esterase